MNIYVAEEDGLIHFTDKAGADTALPFSGDVDTYKYIGYFKGNSGAKASYNFTTDYARVVAVCVTTSSGSGIQLNFSTNANYQTLLSNTYGASGGTSRRAVFLLKDVKSGNNVSLTSYVDGKGGANLFLIAV